MLFVSCSNEAGLRVSKHFAVQPPHVTCVMSMCALFYLTPAERSLPFGLCSLEAEFWVLALNGLGLNPTGSTLFFLFLEFYFLVTSILHVVFNKNGDLVCFRLL